MARKISPVQVGKIVFSIIFIGYLLSSCATIGLYKAVAKNDVEYVKRAISQKYDLDDQLFVMDPTPLISAIDNTNMEIVRLLLNAGADPNRSQLVPPLKGSGIAQAPILLAAQKGQTQTVILLLEKGANPNLRNVHGTTALMWAAIKNDTKMARVLLESGANPSFAEFESKASAMSLAIQHSSIDFLKLLFEKDVGKNNFELVKDASILVAAYYDNTQIVELFLEHGADPNLRNNNGTSALMWAAVKNNTQMARSLLNYNADPYFEERSSKSTALTIAIANKSYNVLSLLLEAGTSPNRHLSNGTFPLLVSVSLGDLTAARLLLEKGADINMIENNGVTALMLAASKGAIDSVKLLLEHNPNTSIQQWQGATAYDIAASHNYFGVAKLIESASKTKTATPKEKVPSEETNFIIVTGTGWLTESGYIVTNEHVVRSHVEALVRFNSIGDTTFKAEVVASDASNDLAILRLIEWPDRKVKAIKIAASQPTLGEQVFTIGYPMTSIMGNNPKLTNGIISALSGIRDDPRIVQTTVAIQSGNSGGPLINMNGEAVAVTTSTLEATMTEDGIDLLQNVNYAIKAAYATSLLSTLPQRRAMATHSFSNQKLQNIVPLIQDSVVQVLIKRMK